MGTTTTKLDLYKPNAGETGWGSQVNANFDTLDNAIVKADPEPEINDLEAGQMKVYADEATDNLVFFLKYNDGTFMSGELSLAPVPTPTPTPTPTV